MLETERPLELVGGDYDGFGLRYFEWIELEDSLVKEAIGIWSWS